MNDDVRIALLRVLREAAGQARDDGTLALSSGSTVEEDATAILASSAWGEVVAAVGRQLTAEADALRYYAGYPRLNPDDPADIAALTRVLFWLSIGCEGHGSNTRHQSSDHHEDAQAIARAYAEVKR